MGFMSSTVSFKLRELTSAITNQFVRVTDTDRNEIFSGNTLSSDAEGNVIVEMGYAGTDGQKVLIYGDTFTGSNHTTFHGFCGGGEIVKTSNLYDIYNTFEVFGNLEVYTQ